VTPSSPTLLLRLAPALFVLLWSTGWIAARFGAPYADPLSFLVLRYIIAGCLLSGLALMVGAPWPRGRAALHVAVSGVLLHAIYLGGVWWAIAQGLPAGISGLIAAVQPILTALLAPKLAGERITRLHWAGIALGFVGIGLVLEPKLIGITGFVSGLVWPVIINVLAMISVTFGTFYQKRFVPTGDLRSVTALQYAGAALATLPIALLSESFRFAWNQTLVLTMAWSVLALSMGAIGLFLLLIRNGAVYRAAALIYLVPPAVALEAYWLFGETLLPLQVAGMMLAAAGVALATRR
jgi:drug/metabolite transporter (DMT)-like permease